jgi:hypothetical protein
MPNLSDFIIRPRSAVMDTFASWSGQARAKHVITVPLILASSNPFKVFRAIVASVSVLMVYLKSVRPWAMESSTDERVRSSAYVFPVSYVYLFVPTFIKGSFENPRRGVSASDLDASYPAKARRFIPILKAWDWAPDFICHERSPLNVCSVGCGAADDTESFFGSYPIRAMHILTPRMGVY